MCVMVEVLLLHWSSVSSPDPTPGQLAQSLEM